MLQPCSCLRGNVAGVPQRHRIDAELVRRGLSNSRTAASAAIADGRVTVNGAPVDRASRLVSPGDQLLVADDGIAFVARSGAKLDAVFDRFDDVDATDVHAVDCGSSTGGFTECLLRRGARRVTAIDVGRHQLHERLRNDPRVAVYEQTDVRSVDVSAVGGPFPMLVADLSFISLLSVRDALLQLCQPEAIMVLLVKPQFEVGRVEAARARGVIRDADQRHEALNRIIDGFAERGCTRTRWMESPIAGGSGNVEFLLVMRAP
jgi:23S rRNA (cytidine1920-2'-O)/16S rRNA (cytidine1409-2'-O)-methyltransferase